MTQASTMAASGTGGGRTIARPLANLGNTCFANAVLQALAHAPELCLAIDCRPHSMTCPIAIENSAKLRASPSISPTEDPSRSTGTRKSRRSVDRSSDDEELEFCALCALESHIQQVHDSAQPRDKPVAPEAFIKGFCSHVAPWMRIGIQEDSHEFLRLLIDAMQKSCLQARNEKENSKSAATNPSSSPEDKEYSFSLFRGLVESNVTCQYCNTSSSTVDPIEDIGLEVTTVQAGHDGQQPLLADVQSAFSGFARAEALDSNYKCEKCGKVGKATKQSRLKSIPPILTLHLKRFRYGDSRHGADAVMRRSGRSEVKSGSAKIEGHVKFELLFDLKPYLTKEMQDATKGGMVCRLFAVIVHAGKNSNSGHYIAYVRNIDKNDWWKMDDGRVNPVHVNEVLEAEAYMLFYRVVQHPLTQELENCYRTMMNRAKMEKALEDAIIIDQDSTARQLSKVETQPKPITTGKRKLRSHSNGQEWARTKKNLPPHMISIIHKVQERIADNTQLSPEFFRRLSEAASSDGAHASNTAISIVEDISNSLPAAVADITESDFLGNADLIRCRLWELFHNIASQYESKGLSWSLSDEADSDPLPSNDPPPLTGMPTRSSSKTSTARISLVEPEDALLL